MQALQQYSHIVYETKAQPHVSTNLGALSSRSLLAAAASGNYDSASVKHWTLQENFPLRCSEGLS